MAMLGQRAVVPAPVAEVPPAGPLQGAQPARAIALAREAARVLGSLGQRVHASWIGLLGPAGMPPQHIDRLLLARFDLRWPDLGVASGGLEHLWLLPPAQVRRVCVARALYERREALARCVTAGLRRDARALLGDVAFNAMTARTDKRQGGAALPSHLDGDRLCALGWQRLKAAVPWGDLRSRRLVELMLPPANAATAEGPLALSDHPSFMADLPALIPEHAWLFGSGTAATT
jgi:hypothetical protein